MREIKTGTTTDNRRIKQMNLQDLKEIKPSRVTNGRPSFILTDREWQNEFEVMKLYVKPHSKNITRMGGKHSRGTEKVSEDSTYDGITNWQSYCSYINDVLRNIRKENRDFCYYGYQLVELLKFHHNNLRTRYCNGYWEVWLELQNA